MHVEVKIDVCLLREGRKKEDWVGFDSSFFVDHDTGEIFCGYVIVR